MNSISNVSSQHIVNALQLSNLMSFANLLYKFWIIFNVIIKDNKTRLCFVINQRCLTHVFCTTENNIKYVFLVFSEKIKFWLKPIRYEFSLFFFYFQVTLYNPLGFLEYYIQRGIRSPAFSEARLTSLKWLLSTYRAQRLLELFRIQSPARLKKKSLIIHGIFLKDQYLTWIIWEVLSLRQ